MTESSNNSVTTLQQKLDSVANDLTSKISKDELDNVRKDLNNVVSSVQGMISEIDTIKKFITMDVLGDLKSKIQKLELESQNKSKTSDLPSDKLLMFTQVIQKVDQRIASLEQKSNNPSSDKNALDYINNTLNKHTQQLMTHSQNLSSVGNKLDSFVNSQNNEKKVNTLKVSAQLETKKPIGSYETSVDDLVQLSPSVQVPVINKQNEDQLVSPQLLNTLTSTPSIFGSNRSQSIFPASDRKINNNLPQKQSGLSGINLMEFLAKCATTLQSGQPMQQMLQSQNAQQMQQYKNVIIPNNTSTTSTTDEQATMQALQEYVKTHGTQNLPAPIASMLQTMNSNNSQTKSALQSQLQPPTQAQTQNDSYMAIQQQLAKKTAQMLHPTNAQQTVTTQSTTALHTPISSVKSSQNTSALSINRGNIRTSPLSTPFRT
jgi:hypothetical protein